MSISIELSFAQSAVITYDVIGGCSAASPSSTAGGSLKRPSVALLHGAALCCGVPMALYGAVPLECATGSATVIDCVSESGCRLQLSSGGDSFRQLNVRRVPFAYNSLQRFLGRIRDARVTAKTANRPPPRCLIVGFGDGASSWCARCSSLAFSSFSSTQADATAPAAIPPSIIINMSLAPHEVTMRAASSSGGGGGGNNNQSMMMMMMASTITRTVPVGCISLQFVEGSAGGQPRQPAAVAFDPVCCELYTFFVGSSRAQDAGDEETLLEVLATINDIILRISSASIEFASACLIVNMGELVACPVAAAASSLSATGSDSASDSGAAAAAAASASSLPRRIGSLLPKVLRLLRISHVGALLGTASSSAVSAAALTKALETAVSSVVYGVVLEVIPVYWPPTHHHQQQQQQMLASSAEMARSETVQRYLCCGGDGRSTTSAAVYRLVLDASRLNLLDAKTLKPLLLAQVTPFALCAVVSASAAVAEKVAQAAAVAAGSHDSASEPAVVVVHSALRRAVVGFVVVSDIGAASALVVVSPVSGDLPSNTLLVANDLTVDARFVPSVLETY